MPYFLAVFLVVFLAVFHLFSQLLLDSRLSAIEGCSYAKRDISLYMVLYLYQKNRNTQ